MSKYLIQNVTNWFHGNNKYFLMKVIFIRETGDMFGWFQEYEIISILGSNCEMSLTNELVKLNENHLDYRRVQNATLHVDLNSNVTITTHQPIRTYNPKRPGEWEVVELEDDESALLYFKLNY